MLTRAPNAHSPMGLVAASGPTLAQVFEDTVRRCGAAIAIIEGSRVTTFAELAGRVQRLRGHLLSLGLRAGDRVAIVSENRAEYLEVVLACAGSGLIAACQNWRQTGPEMRHCIELVDPGVCFASPRHAALVPPDLAPVTLFGPDYEAALDAAEPVDALAEIHPEDGLLILYTSGTTGLPKGALISHRAMIARSMAMMADWRIRSTDGFIAWSPFFHMASADPSLSSLCQGATVFIVDGFDAPAIVDGLAAIDVGWFVLMPGMIERMIEAVGTARAQGRTLRRVAVTGCMANLVPPAQIAQISQLLGAPFLNSFGSTETGIAPASGHLLPIGEEPTDLGKIQTSFCTIRLEDPDGEEARAGDIGEMCLRSPTLFTGYWNAPEATAEDFRGGWFHMGDDFRRRSDGFLEFVDRRKYLIKSGGENIYPAEIEHLLRASPRIAEAIVVRQPDDTWGEVPVAFVAARDPSLTEADVLALLHGRLARYKLPRRTIFVREDELERNSTGKIRRQVLEDRLRKLRS